MQGDVSIQMPTDLRTVTPFELEAEFRPRKRKGITALTVDIPSSNHSLRSDETRPPPRWKTPEFALYYAVFLTVIPIMVWVPVDLSSTSHLNYPLIYRRLSQGWIFGRPLVSYVLVFFYRWGLQGLHAGALAAQALISRGNIHDNSDAQYRSFRNNVPVLTVLALSFLLLKFIYARAALRFHPAPPTNNLHQIPFLVAFSIVVVLGLHGTSIIKIFAILGANYAIAKYGRGQTWAPLVTWVFNGAVLFANEWNSGYTFATLHPSFVVLDALPGVYPRWHVSFNITMLRLVSFNMDYFWACNRIGPSDTGSTLTEKQRTSTVHSLDTFSFKNYIAYTLYPPLYIAGPIMTFNDFMWQQRRPTSISLRTVIVYAFRYLTCLFAMELILHFMYVVAIKDMRAWHGDSPFQLSMIGFWNLMIVWLKLLLPWRFFRLWALADGIDPPENMVRCMANNYSTLGFWRSWHRSYNLWLIRYIYIPLGGTKNIAISAILIFTFVALWHDLSFRLLAWGWLVSLFIAPELTAKYLLPASKYGSKAWYRHVCAGGAVFNILMMISANLVGFAIGTEGMMYMVKEIVGTWSGLRFLGAACACIFVGVQVMFEYREEEMRRGIFRRC